jgi:hypothetical protein
MGRTLIVVGLVIAGVGALVTAGVPVGRLPGDLLFRRGGVSIYLPLATSLLVSVALTLAFAWFRR